MAVDYECTDTVTKGRFVLLVRSDSMCGREPLTIATGETPADAFFKGESLMAEILACQGTAVMQGAEWLIAEISDVLATPQEWRAFKAHMAEKIDAVVWGLAEGRTVACNPRSLIGEIPHDPDVFAATIGSISIPGRGLVPVAWGNTFEQCHERTKRASLHVRKALSPETRQQDMTDGWVAECVIEGGNFKSPLDPEWLAEKALVDLSFAAIMDMVERNHVEIHN